MPAICHIIANLPPGTKRQNQPQNINTTFDIFYFMLERSVLSEMEKINELRKLRTRLKAMKTYIQNLETYFFDEEKMKEMLSMFSEDLDELIAKLNAELDKRTEFVLRKIEEIEEEIRKANRKEER